MKIVKKEEDYRIYVENDNEQYISSNDVLYSENRLSKRITFNIHLNNEIDFRLDITREELKSLTEMLNEVIKFL